MTFKPPRINTKERRAKKAEQPEAARIDVFEIDGKMWTMPADMPPAAGVRYLRNLRDFGRDIATIRLITEAIGSEAVDALAACNEIERDEMADIVAAINAVCLGATDPGKDSSTEASS